MQILLLKFYHPNRHFYLLKHALQLLHLANLSQQIYHFVYFLVLNYHFHLCQLLALLHLLVLNAFQILKFHYHLVYQALHDLAHRLVFYYNYQELVSILQLDFQNHQSQTLWLNLTEYDAHDRWYQEVFLYQPSHLFQVLLALKA